MLNTTAKARRVRETPELAGAARRMIRALGRRCSTDVEGLAELAQLHAEVEAQLVAAIAAARSGEDVAAYSWTDIGRVLGITRQAAQQRYGRVDTARDERTLAAL